MNISTQGWQDLQVAEPIDPKSVILYAALGANNGTFVRSTSALQPGWVASPLVYTGNNTQVVSLDTTDGATVIDATQWTFNHQMVNVGLNIPPVLNTTAYLRAGGAIFQNQLEIALGGTTYNNIQLTFRDNLGTSGQFLNSGTGSIPVISLGSGLTGNQILKIAFTRPGIYQMALVMTSGGGNPCISC